MTDKMAELFDRRKAWKALEWVQEMSHGSAEQFYASDYLTCRVAGMEKPAVVEYGLPAKVAEAIRDQIDQRLPEDV